MYLRDWKLKRVSALDLAIDSGKYITHTDKFDETLHVFFSVGFWLFYIDGDIGEFASLRVEVRI